MSFRLFLLLAVPAILTCPQTALSKSDAVAVQFTLQVASFPDKDQANRFMSRLVNAGEHPLCATVELQGRGYWTRVFVGAFNTFDEARRYGERLVSRGLIAEFLVRNADLNQEATRPRRVTQKISDAIVGMARLVSAPFPASGYSVNSLPVKAKAGVPSAILPDLAAAPLPALRSPTLNLKPVTDTCALPRPDAVALAIRMILGAGRSFPVAIRQRGGLWITGDTAEGLARLRWIVGEQNAELISIDTDGRVQLDRKLLARVSGIGAPQVDDPLNVAGYIASNEGLLLVIQLSESKYYRYCLHLGPFAPTAGISVEIAGSVNLDNNFDSRINPYRKHAVKLDSERPPKSFDSLVGINPVARWFNLSTNCWVPVGEVTFHELAEAYAKLEFDLDYLEMGGRPGAHAVALGREQLLKSQRPGAAIVLTLGANRVLKNEQEIRLFYAEQPGGASQR
jgi:hypothetical protein